MMRYCDMRFTYAVAVFEVHGSIQLSSCCI